MFHSSALIASGIWFIWEMSIINEIEETLYFVIFYYR